MGINRKSLGMRKAQARKLNSIQVVYSEPLWTLKEWYVSPKGKKLYAEIGINITKEQHEEIWAKYGKKRYVVNPNARAIRVILHR